MSALARYSHLLDGLDCYEDSHPDKVTLKKRQELLAALNDFSADAPEKLLAHLQEVLDGKAALSRDALSAIKDDLSFCLDGFAPRIFVQAKAGKRGRKKAKELYMTPKKVAVTFIRQMKEIEADNPLGNTEGITERVAKLYGVSRRTIQSWLREIPPDVSNKIKLSPMSILVFGEMYKRSPAAYSQSAINLRQKKRR